MKRNALVFPLLATLFAALNVIPIRRANADHHLSLYCIGTSPRRNIEIEVDEKSFHPNRVTVDEGDCINLVIHATGGESHNLIMKGTSVSSEGAPLLNSEGIHIGRAVARPNPSCPTCGSLAEGFFTTGETVLLTFQVNTPGSYEMQSKGGMHMVIEAKSRRVGSTQ